jgi:hypothetical protein
MPTVAEIDAQIRQLEDQKKALVQKEKDAALAKAQAAINELKEMGFNYRLASMDGGTVPFTTKQGTRRTGIREQVLKIVEGSPDGITRADVLSKLDAKGDKSAEQSASNALAALKKANQIDLKDGKYIAA